MSFSKQDLADLCNFLNKTCSDNPEDALGKNINQIESLEYNPENFNQDQLILYQAEDIPTGKALLFFLYITTMVRIDFKRKQFELKSLVVLYG